jgi:hypothetical protein
MTSLTPLSAARLTSETLLGVLQKPQFRQYKIREVSMEAFDRVAELTPTTNNDAKIELTEQELSRITGGRGKTSEKPLEFLKITMKLVTVSS